jgi:hypothetical protein
VSAGQVRAARCVGYRGHLPHFIMAEDLEKATPLSWNDGTLIVGMYRCDIAKLLSDKRPSSQRQIREEEVR